MITGDKISHVVDIIVKNVNILKIIQSGSYAYGDPNEDSNLNILVIKNTDDD